MTGHVPHLWSWERNNRKPMPNITPGDDSISYNPTHKPPKYGRMGDLPEFKEYSLTMIDTDNENENEMESEGIVQNMQLKPISLVEQSNSDTDDKSKKTEAKKDE